MKIIPLAVMAVFAADLALAQGAGPSVTAANQSVANGVVSADSVTATENGYLVVHRTDAAMKPGPVLGYSPIRAGENADVPVLLSEDVAPGDMLMLMVHSEAGGTKKGVWEYTLGAKEDGPIRVNDQLVMTTITAE